jgi:hypothetical protein
MLIKIINPTRRRIFVWIEDTCIHEVQGFHSELSIVFHPTLSLSSPDGKGLAVLVSQDAFGDSEPWQMELSRIPALIKIPIDI